MSKICNPGKIGWVLGGLALFLSFNSAYASVVINEVMYDLDGGDIDYFEVFNDGNSEIDLSGYKFVINDDTVNGHGINANSSLSNIQPGDYGVIVSSAHINNFLSRWPDSGNVFTGSFSLPNSIATTISLRDQSGTEVNQARYVGGVTAAGDGNSLQLINGSWQAATPTPGQANQSSSSSDGGDTENSNTTNENSNTIVEPKPKITTSPTMKAKIVASNLAFTGQPFRMEADISGFSNENISLGRVYWNFGDGVSLEQVNNFENFHHIYHYPGDYVVLVEYYRNDFSETPDATAKMIIKVIPTTVTISKVGDAKDFFVELSNNANSDIDVSNWVINANGKTFSLPKNSVIMSKKQMTISGRVTGFTHGDQYSLKLFSSTGEMVFDYAPPPTRQPISTLSLQGATTEAGQAGLTAQAEDDVEEVNEVGEVSSENLQATAIESDIAKNNPIRTYLLTTVFTVFLGVSTGAVYFIRKKRNPLKAGDDFKILDE